MCRSTMFTHLGPPATGRLMPAIVMYRELLVSVSGTTKLLLRLRGTYKWLQQDPVLFSTFSPEELEAYSTADMVGVNPLGPTAGTWTPLTSVWSRHWLTVPT